MTTVYVSKLDCGQLNDLLAQETDLTLLRNARDKLCELRTREYSDRIDIPKDYPEKIPVTLTKTTLIIDGGRDGVNRVVDRLDCRIDQLETK